MDTQNFIKNLSKDAKPCRSKPLSTCKAYALWLISAIVSSGAGIAILGARPDIGDRMFEWLYLLEVLPLAGISLLSAYLALVVRIPGKKAHFARAEILILMGALSAGLLVAALCTECISSFFDAFTVYWASGMVCMSGLLVTALPPSIILFILGRRAAPCEPAKMGFFTAVSGAALGAFTVNLYCGIDQAFHHILWTVLPAFLVILVGLRVASKALRW